MDYTKVFYWLSVADNAKIMFITFIVIFTIIATIFTVGYFLSLDEDYKEEREIITKWIWWSYPFMILFWSLYVFTPSKKDALLIVAGDSTLNFLTRDSSASKIPSELSSYLLTEIKNLSKEAEVELNLKFEKEKLLNEVKTMSAQELIDKMRSDKDLKTLILED